MRLALMIVCVYVRVCEQLGSHGVNVEILDYNTTPHTPTSCVSSDSQRDFVLHKTNSRCTLAAAAASTVAASVFIIELACIFEMCLCVYFNVNRTRA